MGADKTCAAGDDNLHDLAPPTSPAAALSRSQHATSPRPNEIHNCSASLMTCCNGEPRRFNSRNLSPWCGTMATCDEIDRGWWSFVLGDAIDLVSADVRRAACTTTPSDDFGHGRFPGARTGWLDANEECI